MKKTTRLSATALTALVCSGPVIAHHSGNMYATTPVWARGTVVRFERIDPHTITTLEERSADGQLRRWVIEGPGKSQLDRLGLEPDVPKIGEVLAFCAFSYNATFADRFPSRDADGTPVGRVAGHVMVREDGTRRLWEPHGLISECILSMPDERQAWLDFLNSNPRGREGLCEQRARSSIRTNESLRAPLEAINRALDDPCD